MAWRIPWRDRAILLRQADDERVEVASGDLLSIVYRLDGAPRGLWPEYLISLPDRGDEPYAYTADKFERLIRRRPRI